MFRKLLILTVALTSSLFGLISSANCIEKQLLAESANPQFNQHVVLLNDTSAWYHWGCTGTSSALKEEVLNLGYHLTAIPITVTYECKQLPSNIKEFTDPIFFQKFCESNSDLMNTISSADILLINGEGTIHGLNPGPKALLYLAYATKAFLNKHVEIINHSIYPEDTLELYQTEATEIFKLVYQTIDFTAARDIYSVELMKTLGIEVTQSFDCLPLYIHKHYNNKKNVDCKNIVVAGSAKPSKKGVEDIVKYLKVKEQEGYKIQILIGAKAYNKAENTLLEYLSTYQEATGWKIIDAKSMEEWLDVINNASLLVSGRFHHSIAAACLQTPFIALNSNTPKVHAIMEMMGFPHPFLYDEENLFQKLLDQTEVVLSADYKRLDDQTFSNLRKLGMQNFEGLRKKVNP